MVSKWRQCISFGCIGLLTTGLDLAGFALLTAAGLSYIPALLLSTSAGLAVSFWLNRRHTFANQGSPGRFLLVILSGLWVLQPLVLALVSHYFGTAHTTLLVGKLLATGLTSVWNFSWYRLVVFRPPNTNSH